MNSDNKWPSIWIQSQFEPAGGGKLEKVWDISVKMDPLAEPTHVNKPTKEEAIEYCMETYGKYDSIRDNF